MSKYTETVNNSKAITDNYTVKKEKISGITVYMYIPKEKKEKDMEETNLQHYKEQLKTIFNENFREPGNILFKIKKELNNDKSIKTDCYLSSYTDDILNWMAQPYKEPILDEVEREYLSAVIKPFKGNVDYICKRLNHGGYYIAIVSNGSDVPKLPYFPNNEMYKGMELDHRYKLKELGL